MSKQRSVVSGVQFWNNIIASVDQKVMTDIHTASNTWKERNGNAAIVSLKKEWKPTFRWDKDDLVLEAVPKYDVVATKKRGITHLFYPSQNIAFMFGFVKPVPSKNTYTLGPTIVVRYQEIPATNIPGQEVII